MERSLRCRRRRRKKDFGAMKLSDLGKPDEDLFVWRGDTSRLESFGSEHGRGRGRGSPGFAKWTVQEAPGERFDWLEMKGFYCCEAQGRNVASN
uniref:Uncharacterized protein n=1 Tax=Oryza meridionalis TaxID=40149 RepID=A0A0E0C3K6_9ORYZ